MVSQQAKGAPTKDIGVPDFAWGQWGQGLLSDWWESSPELVWPQSVVTYGRMRHDPQIKGVLGAYLYPLLRANWALDPAGCRDEVVQHCAGDIGLPILGADPKPTAARRRGVIWKRHLRQLLGYQIYGYMPFERRYRFDDKIPDLLHLDNLGQRMPWTIAAINMARDTTIETIQQSTQADPIPASRLVWYVSDQEGANWAGISPLRACYAAWLLKHETWRVHATSIRRFGMGVPEVTAPVGATQGQVMQAQQLASSIRAGSGSGVGLPNGFSFKLQGLVGSIPDPVRFIEYLDSQISRQALAGLMDLGDTKHGSRALGETFLDFFILSLQSLADDIAITATSGHPGMPGIVVDLVDQNWGPDEPAPQIVCTDLGTSYELTEDVINRLVQFGAIDPDPQLEAFLRKRWNLPQRDPNAPSKIPPPGIPDAPKPIPANDEDPAETGEPAPSSGGKPASTAIASGAPSGLRRKLTTVEASAGLDPGLIRQEWQDATSMLVEAYKAQALTPLRASLVDQIVTDLTAGRLDRLGSLPVDAAAAADLVQGAMEALALTAANRMRQEAAAQGVTIPGDVKINMKRLGQLASARSVMLGRYLAQQASTKALQVSAADGQQPPPPAKKLAPADVGAAVALFLEGLSDRSVRDQLGASLTAAQHAGRFAVLELADELGIGVGITSEGGTPAGPAYIATEIEDDNICSPCRDIDGTTFPDLAAAEGAYPVGGYIGCAGGDRCRGTIFASWGGA